jgi:hypothetical protein
MNRSFWARVQFICICFTVTGLVLAYGFSKGAISSPGLGVALVLLICVLFVLIMYRGSRTRLVKKLAESSGEKIFKRTTTARAVRRLQVATIALPIFLVFGLWLAKGEPLVPRLVGVVINLCITCWFIFLLRQAKKGVK